MSFTHIHSVSIGDVSDELLHDMLDYCHEANLSLKNFENTDVSDVSLRWDMIATFNFSEEDDLLMFKLKFKTK